MWCITGNKESNGLVDEVAHRLLFQPRAPSYPEKNCTKLTLSDGVNEICATLYTYAVMSDDKRKKIPSKKYIIYSHGNACDMGDCNEFCQAVALFTKHNVVVYDYPGYGRSTGKPNESNIQDSCQTVINFLLKDKNVQLNNIVLFGTSLGTFPTLYLAKKYPQVKCVILETPFLSPSKVFLNGLFGCLWTRFSNERMSSDVKSPVLIFHGSDDTVIPFWHGERLFKILPKVIKKKKLVMVSGANHNDVRQAMGISKYLEELRDFIGECENKPNNDRIEIVVQ
jgi:pimeloyl-ACP methyl ester carboxylesterase